MQVDDHGQIQPSYTRPNVADITSPLLIWRIRCEVPIQLIWGDVELMITIRRDLVFAGPYDRYTVLAHQSSHKAMPHLQADLFQLFRHPSSSIAAKAETRLF